MSSLVALLVVGHTTAASAAEPERPAPTPEPIPTTLTYLRVDTGLVAPAGVVALTFGVAAPRFSIEASLGKSFAVFLSLTGRVRLHQGPSLRVSVGGGATRGGEQDVSCCRDLDDTPMGGTWWLHQELAFERLAYQAMTVHLAIGIDELVDGRYHWDAADISIVDRTPGSVSPYARLGVGFAY